jgi:hypothetical protein
LIRAGDVCRDTPSFIAGEELDCGSAADDEAGGRFFD